MTTTFYLLPNEHLPTLKALMTKAPEAENLWYWKDGNGDEDQMDAILNHIVPTHSEQSLDVDPLVIPDGMFVVGVGVAWHEGDKIISKNSDLFPHHVIGDLTPLTALLCLRRDFANHICPKECRSKGTMGAGFSLDNEDGYYALRVNGLYE